MNINVNINTIEDFEKDVEMKKERVAIILEQMITETEEIKPFFNTQAGVLINEALLELLNDKKNKIVDLNSAFVSNLKTAEGMYTAALQESTKAVS